MENGSPGNFFNLFTVCSSCKRKLSFVVFLDEEKNGSYSFRNGLNGLVNVHLASRWTVPLIVTCQLNKILHQGEKTVVIDTMATFPLLLNNTYCNLSRQDPRNSMYYHRLPHAVYSLLHHHTQQSNLKLLLSILFSLYVFGEPEVLFYILLCRPSVDSLQ
jgi:hypothetical protein